MTDFTTMSGPELVTAFNDMLATSGGKRLAEGNPHRYREVSRFADTKTAVARCEALASSIRATNGAAKSDEEAAPKARRSSSAKAPRIKEERVPKAEGSVRAPKSGGNREKLIAFFTDGRRIGKPYSLQALSEAIYAVSDKVGPTLMVLKGLQTVDIDQRGLPYRLEKTKNGKDITFALHPKG